jgi:DNA-binding beta-propeller fold protein YncE
MIPTPTQPYRSVWRVTLCVVAAALVGPTGASAGAGTERERQPVALAFSRDGTHLFVANLKSGSLSVIDPRQAKVTSEHDLGRGLSDLAVLEGGRHLLTVDREAGALLLVEWNERKARVVDRREVGLEPSSVALRPSGAACVVSVTGSHRLCSLSIERRDGSEGAASPRFTVGWTIELPFAPRNLAWLAEGSRLVVSDAYGGKLALVDADAARLVSVRDLPAHNIRGLAVSPDGKFLVLAHQVLRRLARTSFEDVHWGSLLSNHLRVLSGEAVLSEGDLLRGSRTIDLGGTGNAAGDPAAVAIDRAAGMAVALAGVDEVALGPEARTVLRRVSVGRRPTAVVAAPGGSAWYVADTFDDTVTVIDRPSGLLRATIPLGARPTLDAVARGERLFHDARLSHDSWMSCHSCHTDGHTNGLLSDTLGDGSYGAPKRVPSLLGVAATGPWTWTGSVRRLEDQVSTSIESTMQGKPLPAASVADLTAFLRSLPPPKPIGPAGPGNPTRGERVFRERKCAECHAPPSYTTASRYDVGLSDAVGNREFNPPSLRGVGARSPLLHDGSAATLADVFRSVGHPSGSRFSDTEIADLIAFLGTL